jgi:hypothetical protein
MRKIQILVSLAFCIVPAITVAVISGPAYACLVESCYWAWPYWVPVNFGNTLVYERAEGICTVQSGDGRVIQRLTTCRRTWHSIVYTADKLLFYDRSGDLEIYSINQQGVGSRLQRFTHAQNRVRMTWAEITSPQAGVITFRDDNGQTENYRITNSGMLERI